MSKIIRQGKVSDCYTDHAQGVSCPGHTITVTHDLSTDMVEVLIESDGGAGSECYLFNDVIWAEIVETWNRRKGD